MYKSIVKKEIVDVFDTTLMRNRQSSLVPFEK